MRAVIKGVEVEGSAEELAKFYLAISISDPRDVRAVEASTNQPEDCDEDGADTEGISEKFAYRAIRRLPLSTAQRALLRILAEASPAWTLSSQLQSSLACSPTSLGGVLGGLGRRISTTKGYESAYCLWEQRWDDDEGEWAYRLPIAVINALDRVEL